MILLGLVLALFCEPSFARGIIGSDHDFRSKSWSGGELCVVCHAAHNNSGPPGSPLWNHRLSTAKYTLYTSATLNAVVGQPDGDSKLCLGCHDGTVAVDAYGSRPGTAGSVGGIGRDLRRHHPFSFVYDTALALTDGKLANPATKMTELGGTIQHDLLRYGKLQCSSCHDVHDKAGNSKLFKIPDTNGRLCNTCHQK